MPEVQSVAIERLAREAGYVRWPDLDRTVAEAADEVVAHAAQCLAGEREERSLNLWFLGAVWVAVGTLVTVHFEADYPAEAWYDWPFIWIGATMLTGVGLTAVYGTTVLLHGVWWRHFGRRRDERLRAELVERWDSR